MSWVEATVREWCDNEVHASIVSIMRIIPVQGFGVRPLLSNDAPSRDNKKRRHIQGFILGT